ncbi:MAG: ABC transporter substrate-binding protein [Bilophila wadsworthia]
MKKRMGIVAAVATAMLCSSFAFAAPIKIGLMAPITGAFASEGQDMQKICELMTEELNKAGGINGNKVQLVIEDDGSTPRSAATAASRLVAADVCAAIGTYGSAVTEASQDIYDEAGIVQIGTGPHIRLTAKGMGLLPHTAATSRAAWLRARWLVRLQKVAILRQLGCQSSGRGQTAHHRQKSADIVFDALVPGDDYSAILTKIGRKLTPSVHCHYPGGPAAAPDAGNGGLCSSSAATPPTTRSREDHGDAAAGYRFISRSCLGHRHPEGQGVPQGVRAKYRGCPAHLVRACQDAITCHRAIKAKGPDPAAIVYLHNDLKNLTGQISFDEAGDRVATFTASMK